MDEFVKSLRRDDTDKERLERIRRKNLAIYKQRQQVGREVDMKGYQLKLAGDKDASEHRCNQGVKAAVKARPGRHLETDENHCQSKSMVTDTPEKYDTERCVDKDAGNFNGKLQSGRRVW
jgi:hypothetical protein